MRVVVTRPAREAAPWAEALRARGHDVVLLPLIAIAPARDPVALAEARSHLDRYDAAMFVSANAVHGFLAASAPWPARCAAWGTGPGTAAVLREAGVPPASIVTPSADGGQYDSEALWARARDTVKAGFRLLIVRGAGDDGEAAGRPWLAETAAAAGAQVDTVVAYERGVPGWDSAQLAAAREAATDGSVWLFSSSEAIVNLRALLPGADWSRARAIATHERIAQAARTAGFAVVWLSRPDRDAVVRTLESSG